MNIHIYEVKKPSKHKVLYIFITYELIIQIIMWMWSYTNIIKIYTDNVSTIMSLRVLQK